MKRKKLTIALVASTVAALMLVATLSVYAYFTTRVYVYTEDGKEVAHVGMNLQLLFGKLSGVAEGTDLMIPSYNVVDANGNIVTVTENNATYWANVAGTGQYLHYNDGVNDKTTYDPDAPWGSAQNPYIISETRHLQNLSALQSVGYFDLLYVANNFDENGNYIKGSASIPYFLICTDTTSTTTGAVVGSPVTIDGSALDSPIKPIGSAEHPFIGVIGGAFNTTDSPTTTVVDKTSSVSAIHGFKIQTNTNQTDVGLFGYVGFLGKEPTAAELEILMESDTYVPAFEGVFSSIQNMLISDVSVTVNKPSLPEVISELFEPFWKTFFANQKDTDGNLILHRFTFSDKESPIANPQTVPHETHHIGIFAGHVSYALIDEINVYYSNNDVYALDVTGTSADDNYYSASGILGMMYNMNCTVQNTTATDGTVSGNCVVLLGTGTSNEEIGTGGEGTGTGGGALSGNGRGYVTAAEIFNDFNNVDVTQSNNELLWRYRTGSVWTDNAILILKKKDGSGYTLLDGVTAATVSGTSVSATIDGATATWTNFFVRETHQNNDGEDMLRYVTASGVTVEECVVMGGNDYNGQPIWKFSAGGDGIWHYGIRVTKNGDTYTLDDGTTATYVAESNQFTDGTSVWKSFFIVETVDGTKVPYMYDPVTGVNWTVSIYERKPLTLIEAVNEAGENLCIEWVSTFLIWETETGLYYFYDGVFTFGLSSEEDTIQDTWKNDEAPTMQLGGTSASDWQIDPETDNKAVVALLKPITSNAALEQAIREHKQFYISAKPTGVNDALLMSLQTNSGSGTANPIQGSLYSLGNDLKDHLHDAYASDQYVNLPVVPQTNGSDVNMNVSLDTLKTSAFWDQYTILNIGRTSENLTLDQLRNKYNVVANEGGEPQYFRADTGVLVEPSNGEVSVMEYWDGYFYFTWTYDVETQNYIQKRGKYTINYYYIKCDSSDVVELGQSVSTTSWGLFAPDKNFQSSYVDLTYFGDFIAQDYSDVSLHDAQEYGGVKWYNPGEQEWTTTNAAPIVNLTDNMFLITDANGNVLSTPGATVNGSVVAHDTGETETYYVYDVVEEAYYTSGNVLMTQTEVNNAVSNGTTLLNKYPTYIFSDSLDDKSYLRLLNEWEKKVGALIQQEVGSVFTIWSGTETERQNLEKYLDDETNSVLVFEEGKDYCYIRYAMGNTVKYVGYSHNGQSYNYVGFDNTTAAAQLYVYVIEGIIDMDYGVNTFVPTATNTPALKADQYVLWPQTTLKQDGTYINNGLTLVEGSTENATMTTTTDPVYTIKSLSSMKWGTDQGVQLGSYQLGIGTGFGLNQKFQLADQTGFGPLLNLGDLGEVPIGDDANTMVAPVGSNGVEANVPKGCVAFRVNAGGTQTIRIIVAVPTTIKYIGMDSQGKIITEPGFELDLVQDYYIGVWQVEAAGDSLMQQFNKEDAVEKFELPRSHTFSYEESPQSIEPDLTNNPNAYKPYVDVQYEGTNYRTYLNGDCFLVAYEFTVSGEGVYVIGSVHGTSNTDVSLDVPMEIVHFSVSGTASAGRDGVVGNQLGAIDFVYDDTQGNIATIDKSNQTGGPTNANGEDYANYYASQCLLYSNNEATDANNAFLKINQGTVKIKRHIVLDADSTTTGQSKITCTTTGTTTVTDPFLVKRYAINSDAVILNGVENSG